MLSRIFVLLLAFACATAASRAAAPEPIRYTVRLNDAKAHYAEVEALIPAGGRATVEIFLPTWTPGSYLIREFAKQIEQLTAAAEDGAALTVTKTAKNRWSIAAAGHARVRVRYRLYAREAAIRNNWVEADFAFFNGASTFVTTVDPVQRPAEVSIALPAGWRGVYTALEPTTEPTRFTAPDYDTLVDSPILAGSPQVDKFEVAGTPHYLVTLGGTGVWDNARAAQGAAKVIEAQRTFWGALPFQKPFYIFNLLTGVRSGIEHRHSFVMSAERWYTRTPGGLNAWLSLVSHEYFHAWNGKRLRPATLGPFDYEHECYTPSLWIVEGITSYYQSIMMHRAGLTSRADQLGSFSGAIAGAQSSPGRFVQSLADSSFDTWIKSYRPDENTTNSTVNYYGYGSVAALLLDAEIQRTSGGTKSLDDVMRLAFARYSGAHGYSEAEFEALVSEVAGADLSAWFNRAIRGTGDFDYQPLLDWFGLAFEPPVEKPLADTPGWLGADTKNDAGRLVVTHVRAGSPAQAAGLTPDDEILAIDDYRVRGELGGRLTAYRPGEKVTLLVARIDYLMRLDATLGTEPANRWKLTVRKDATPAQTARLKAWLGDDTPAKASATPAPEPQTDS